MNILLRIKNRILQGRITNAVSKSFFWEIAIAICTFPAAILINRALGAEQRGLLALIMLIPTVSFTIASCQWDRLVKGWITSEKISSNEAWRMTKYYCWILGLIFIPLAILACFFYPEVPVPYRWLSALYCLNWPFFFLQGCLVAIFLATGKLFHQYRMRLTLQTTYLILTILLFYVHKISLLNILIIYFLMSINGLFVGLSMKKNNLSGETFSHRPSLSPLKKAFFPYVLESIGVNADRWAFSFLQQPALFGTYVAFLALLMPFNLLSNALFNGSTSTLNWKDIHSIRRYLKRSTLLLLILSALMIGGSFLIGEPIVRWILGASFAKFAWMIPSVVGVVVANACGLQYHMTLQLAGKHRLYLIIQSAEYFFRLILVFVLTFVMAEKGILIGMILSPLLKCLVCAAILFFSSTWNDIHECDS